MNNSDCLLKGKILQNSPMFYLFSVYRFFSYIYMNSSSYIWRTIYMGINTDIDISQSNDSNDCKDTFKICSVSLLLHEIIASV